MNVVVHLYLTGVRKVQRNIRDFIACKHAKITVLAVLWARLEKGYVKSMLDQRKQQKRSTGVYTAVALSACVLSLGYIIADTTVVLLLLC
jgi:hypothetical protein